jgi:hypothetical protein
MKRVILLVIMATCITSVYGQHKRSKKHGESPIVERPNFHFAKNSNLIRNLDTLKYDSVKIFSFGCGNGFKQPPGLLYKTSNSSSGGFMLGEGFIDSTQHWLPLLSDGGKIIQQHDINKILTTFKNIHNDNYEGMEPVGCFEPQMGIMFYKAGLVNAHMDICFGCSRINLEIFKNERVLFKYHLDMLGVTTNQVFKKIDEGYLVNKCW